MKRKSFVLLRFKCGRIEWFQKERGNRFYNSNGGCILMEAGDTIIKRQRAYSMEELDWTGTYLDIQQDSEEHGPDGFLAPDGSWHGCPYGYHEDAARLVFKERNAMDVEKRGYVHISYDKLIARQKLTLPQIDWLLECEYTEFVQGMEEEYGATPRPEFAPLGVRKPSRLEREGD